MDEDYLSGPDYWSLSWCGEQAQQLTPEVYNQRANSRQGQLLVAAFGFKWELRNAGANWEDYPEKYAAYSEFVVRHLCDGTFEARVCAFVRGAIAELYRWMRREVGGQKVYDAMARVVTLAHHWCRLHPAPIPPEVVLWETVAPVDR